MKLRHAKALLKKYPPVIEIKVMGQPKNPLLIIRSIRETFKKPVNVLLIGLSDQPGLTYHSPLKLTLKQHQAQLERYKKALAKQPVDITLNGMVNEVRFGSY